MIKTNKTPFLFLSLIFLQELLVWWIDVRTLKKVQYKLHCILQIRIELSRWKMKRWQKFGIRNWELIIKPPRTPLTDSDIPILCIIFMYMYVFTIHNACKRIRPQLQHPTWHDFFNFIRPDGISKFFGVVLEALNGVVLFSVVHEPDFSILDMRLELSATCRRSSVLLLK